MDRSFVCLQKRGSQKHISEIAHVLFLMISYSSCSLNTKYVNSWLCSVESSKVPTPKQRADYRPIFVTPIIILSGLMERLVRTFLYPTFLLDLPHTLAFSD